jgi:glycosyltransferase involved in cell wall biosynthesis
MRVVLVLTQARGGPAHLAIELASAVARLAERSAATAHAEPPATWLAQASAAAGQGSTADVVEPHDLPEVIVLGPPALRDAGLPPGMHRPLAVASKLDAGGFAAARAALADLAPDVVHAQDHRAGLVCALVAPRGTPTAMTFHGVPDSAAGRWVQDGPWHGRPLGLAGRSRLVAQHLVGARMNRAVAPSRAMADFLVREVRLQADRVRPIHNGVDVPLTARAPGQVRTFVTVSSFAPCKATPLLVQTFQSLAEGRPDLCLRMVGDGRERRACEELACRAAGRVEFAGYRADVPEQLAIADAFVLPSLNENMPLALLQAMAAGLPCICSDVGGVREVLDDDCGLLVRPGDAGALRAAMEKLVADPDLAARLGAAARRRVQERFTLDHCARDHVLLWRQLARSGHEFHDLVD